ncbi:hypothetical protein MIMGU_mgv11b019013mg [Erythranthe guttata]|uniref:Uncharacterized protein n=1 Tax=Erythranthe guttata TaxID=4155 RepID=A0A022QBF7_ERYGU|nr:hypothetical protein MIMGU_mgv11b019013mg [Erythranthe guttata]
MTLALRHLSLLRSRLQLVTNLFSGRKPNDILLSLDDNQSIQEVFLGARISWVNQIERDHRNQVVSRNFVMRIKKRDKRRVLKPYLQHIHTVSDDIEQRGIYNNRKQRQSLDFNFFSKLTSNHRKFVKITFEVETILLELKRHLSHSVLK